MKNFTLVLLMLVAAGGADATDNIYRVYAVDETHKITQNDTTTHWMRDSNLVWINESINVFGGKNEVVGFQLMIQAKSSGKALKLNVTLDSLYNEAYTIKNSSKDPTQYVGRYIELFKEHYARIDSQGSGSGSLMWYFYPGRGSTDGHPDYAGPSDYYRPTGFNDVKYIPDGLIPFESPKDGAPFNIEPSRIQGVWVDIYIPKGAVAGQYQGTLKVTEGGILRRAVLVRLTVYGFELSDVTHFPAWAYADRQGVEQNFLVPGDWRKGSSLDSIMAAYYRMGHRHRLEVDETISPSQLYNDARMGGYFSGWRFGASEGYEGPGQNAGIPMYAIGIYDQQSRTALTSGALVAHAPHALTRTTGSFIGDGWGAGRAGYISDNSINNDRKFVVTAISGDGKSMTIQGDDLTPLPAHHTTLYCLFKNSWARASGFADAAGFETRDSWWSASNAWEQFFRDSAGTTVRVKYMIDEPWNNLADTGVDLSNIRTKKEWLTCNPGVGRDLKVIVAGKLDFPRMFPWIDYWMASEGVYYPPGPPKGDSIPSGYVLARARWLQQRGMHVGFYNSNRPAFGITQMIDASAGDARSGPWVAARYGIEFYFVMYCNWYTQSATTMFPNQGRWDVWARPVQYYNWDEAGTGPADDHWSDRVWGNGLLMYPGQSLFFGGVSDKGIRGPIASIRLKNWRRGQQDYEYIYLARKLGLGDEVSGIIDAVVPWALDQRPGYEGSEKSRKTQPAYPENGYRFEVARKAIAELISAATRGSMKKRTSE
jgi:hypothetical protein